MPVRIRRIVLYTRSLVVLGARELGSSRSCAARDGSCRWMSPSVAVLTGAEVPFAPPTTRGGGMKNTSWCWVINPATGGWSKFWFWSNVGRVLCNYLCASLGTSHKHNSRVMRWMSLVGSGLGGHSAHAACACLASICSNSACLVLLRVPTPGAAVWVGRQVPRPRLLPVFWIGDGVSWSTFWSTAWARGGEIGGVIVSVTGL